MKKNLFILVLAIFACFTAARADELTVANGRTATNEFSPIYGYYYDTGFKNTIVYPAEMLGDMEGGDITSISFYATTDFTALQGGTIQLSVGEIEGNALTGHLTDLTQVYSGAPVKDGVKCGFTFDTPYNYKGGNLAIEVLLTSTGSNCPRIYFHGVELGRNTTWHSYGRTLSNGNTGIDFLPEATFEYESGTPVDYKATVTPTALDFGKLQPNESATKTITIKNKGVNAITPTLSGLSAPYSTEYTPASIENGQETNVSITFNPTTVGEYNQTVTIDCGYQDGSFDVTLTGSCAQEAIIAEGTATNEYLPVYGYNHDTYNQQNQFVYPADMLTSLVGKKLKSITFFPAAVAGSYGTTKGINFKGGSATFSLASVDEGSITFTATNNTPQSTEDLVAVGSINIPETAQPELTEWTINFDEDFDYYGGDLLVDVSTVKGSYGRSYFYGVSTEDYAGFYCSSATAKTGQKFLPKVKFTFEDAGEIEPVYSMEVTSSKAIDCGSVIGAGNAVATEKLVVKNTGNQPVKPTIALSGDNAGMFTIEPAEAAELAPRKSAEYTITFTAAEGTEAGEYTANVAITDGNGNAPAIEDVTVKGTVIATVISGTVTPETLTFTIPAEKTTTGTITIANTGNTAFTPVFSTLEAPFSITEATEIAAGESKEFTITYAPVEEGTNEATLNVTIGEQEPIAVALNGTATEPTHEVVVCDATNTNQYVPFYSFWADTYLVESQFIYPAEKLTDLNGRKIASVKFFAESNVKANGGQLQVSLKETEQTVFADAGNDKVTEMTVAGTCNIDNNSNTIEFIFNEPIAYNGGNLAVEVVALEKSTGVDKTYWLGESQNTATSFYHYGNYNTLNYFLPKAEFGTIAAEQPVEGITLAEMLTTGENGAEYTISDDLAVVDVAQIENHAFLTDGQDNWIRVDYNSDIEDFVLMDAIKGGSLKGTLSNVELNPVLTVTEMPEEGETPVEYTVQSINLADEFDTLKPNQVVKVTGYWNATENTLRGYSGENGAAQGQSMSLNTTWAATENTLENGKRYQVTCAINLKEAWKPATDGISLMDYDYDFQNYLAYALVMPSTPTAIENINLDNVKAVRYYNVAGVESATPFQGVNIVVMEMTDGTTKAVKVVK